MNFDFFDHQTAAHLIYSAADEGVSSGPIAVKGASHPKAGARTIYSIVSEASVLVRLENLRSRPRLSGSGGTHNVGLYERKNTRPSIARIALTPR
jgi:hypothetical protein